MMSANNQYKEIKSKKANQSKRQSNAGKLTEINLDKDVIVEDYDEDDEEEKTDFRNSTNLSELRGTTTTKKHKQKNISVLVNVDVSASQKKQLHKNIEYELSAYQKIFIKSLNSRYYPSNIF